MIQRGERVSTLCCCCCCGGGGGGGGTCAFVELRTLASINSVIAILWLIVVCRIHPAASLSRDFVVLGPAGGAVNTKHFGRAETLYFEQTGLNSE